ncbi:succinate dehydrogenase assembly factor 1, mitochondrial-like [Ictidomys tridecemlineatus]
MGSQLHCSGHEVSLNIMEEGHFCLWLGQLFGCCPPGLCCCCLPASLMSRPSQLQRQVLSLYHELLRAERGKPGANAPVRAQFPQNASLPRADVLRIQYQYQYRRGQRQLQLLCSDHAKALGAFVRPQGPKEEPGGAAALGTPPEDDDGPKSPLNDTWAPEIPPNGR